MRYHDTMTAKPVLALRGLVLFPGMVLHFDVSRKRSLAAIEQAVQNEKEIFIVTQKNLKDKQPELDDLHKIGVLASIRQVMRVPNADTVRVVVEGIERGKIVEMLQEAPYLHALVSEVSTYKNTGFSKDYETAVVRQAKEIFENYAAAAVKLSPDIILNIVAMQGAGELADYIASNIMISAEEKQEILQTLNPVKRLEKLAEILTKETELLALERDIQNKVQLNVDKNQREYYLREQMRVIAGELGEGDAPQTEVEEYREKIIALGLSDESEEKLLKEADKLLKMSGSSQDAYVVRNYLDAVLDLPWHTYTKDKLNLKQAKRVLDQDHFGMKKVKQRIIELLAVRKLAPDLSGQIVCLVGPPGVGKTSIAKSLARAMGRNYVRISLGGIKDEAEIRGHRKTYIGAMQGRILAAVGQAKSGNPLILLDEIDKLGSDYKGDPASAMLEVLDPEQNNSFRDHFIEIPYDLSKVLFITTANDASRIPGPLYDRMEVIELGSYTHEEKYQIAKRHLVPKQLAKHGLQPKQVRFSDSVLHTLIDAYTSEAGVRQLEREVASLCRKAATAIASDECTVFSITEKKLESLIGPKKFSLEEISPVDEIGAVNGLAWTSVGGKSLRIEVAVLDGTGKIELTGSLGDVMKESARAAVSYIRSVADRYELDKRFYKKKDIHIHVPEGAVPKDGPSAGVTISTALLSQLTGTPVSREIAMTGEISLKGKVMPIGGLREKSMAAYRMGVKKVLIPKKNVPDLAEVDDVVKSAIEFIAVESLDEVFAHALVQKEEAATMPPILGTPEKQGTAVYPQ